MAVQRYPDRFRNVRLTQADGVVEATLHSDGGPIVFSQETYQDLVEAFTAIGDDRTTRAVILTGAGDGFITGADLGDPAVSGTPAGFDEYYWRCRRMQARFLEIEAPIIAALNGPVLLHTELALLSDVVLATESATFKDSGHLPNGIVPGDGANVVWSEVLGPVRAKYFFWTQQTIAAREALALGVVNEVLAPADLLPRARELARQIATLPPLTLRYTRSLLNHRIRRRMQEEVAYGMSLEGATVTDVFSRMTLQTNATASEQGA